MYRKIVSLILLASLAIAAPLSRAYAQTPQPEALDTDAFDISFYLRKLTADIVKMQANVEVPKGSEGNNVKLEIIDPTKDTTVVVRSRTVNGNRGGKVKLAFEIENPRLHTLEDHFNYTMRITLQDGEKPVAVWQNILALSLERGGQSCCGGH